MGDDLGREVLGWEEFGAASRELASMVVDDGFRPDLILGVARGGLLVAGSLSYALGLKNCCVINVEYYTGVDERLDVPVILPPHLDVVDLSGAHLLIADDVADTGETMKLVADTVRPQSAGGAHRRALREESLDRAVRLRVAPHRRLDRLPLVGAAADHRRLSGPREHPEQSLRGAENSRVRRRRSCTRWIRMGEHSGTSSSAP